MKKSLLLAGANLRKAKSQSIALVIVLIVAVLFLQIGFILTFDYSANYDKRAKLTNSEDVVFSYQTREDQTVKNWQNLILGDERTAELETTASLCGAAGFKYGSGEMNTHVTIFPSDIDKNLGKFRFVEKVQVETDNTIYLPYLFKTGGNYKIGDNFKLKIKTGDYNYSIGGFYESTMMGSFNGGIVSMLLSKTSYEKLDKETDIQGILFSVKLKDRADNASYLSDMGNKLSGSAQNMEYNSNAYTMVKSARTLTAGICSAIFLGIAILITVISLVIMVFRISNSIDVDMKTYGALQSVGYTSKQIIGSLLMQFLLLGVISIVVGIVLSFAVLPVINTLLVLQTGIIWEYVFNILPILLVFIILLGVIVLTTYLAASKLRRLHPIKALRQGVETHSFKRNPIPLEKSKGNINFLLSLKFACMNLKQNISVFLIITVVSFACVFAGVMLQSFVINPDSMMAMIAGEQTDAAIYTSHADAEEIFAELNERDEVKRAYRFQTVKLVVDGEQLFAYIVDSCEDLNKPEVCYAGRLPKYANEIALGGLMAREHKLKIGDSVAANQDGKEEKYLVTGFIQNTNNLGKDCMMITAGYKKIVDAPLNGEFYVLLNEGFEVNLFLKDITKDYGNKIISTINVAELADGALGVYISIVSLLVSALMIILLAVIALVIYLMVKTYLLKKQHDYGILKALGYTTKQLVMQTAAGFLPVILLATVFGIIMGVIFINPLLSALFGGIGILKAMFPIPAVITVAFGAIIIIFALVTAVLVSLRVRKIAPRALIAE